MRQFIASLAVLIAFVCMITAAGLANPKPQGQDAVVKSYDIRDLLKARLANSSDPGSALAQTVAALKQRITLGLDGERPLIEVVRSIQNATQASGASKGGVVIYIDPVGLIEAEKALMALVQLTPEDRPLGERIEMLAESLDMTSYVQRDGVVVLTTRETAQRNRGFSGARNGSIYLVPTAKTPDARPTRGLSQKGQATLKNLDKVVSMPFANQTPLQDVFQYLSGAAPGFTARFDDVALRDGGKDAFGLVSIDLNGVPLRTTLALLLAQLDLTYQIQSDGTIRIIPLQ